MTGEEVPSYDVARRTFLVGAASVGVFGLTSCGASVAARAAFNPATREFFKTLAINTLGAVVYDLAKAAGFWTRERIDEGVGSVASGACWSTQSYAIEESGVLLVHMTGNRPTPVKDSRSCPAFNPMADHVAVFFPHLKHPLLLPAWAWQTILLFENEYRGYGDTASARDLLRMALRPLSPRVSTMASKLRIVQAVSYEAAPNRWVDIGLSKTGNADGPSGYRGHMEVQGVRRPGISDPNYVGEYLLPVTSA